MFLAPVMGLLPGRRLLFQAAVSWAREAIRRSSSTRCRTYPSSVKWAEALALRLAATIWSRGRRWGNWGSSSRQNSQGRLEGVSKRLTTAGSMWSTKSSWKRRNGFARIVRRRHTFPPRIIHHFLSPPLYNTGRRLYRPACGKRGCELQAAGNPCTCSIESRLGS